MELNDCGVAVLFNFRLTHVATGICKDKQWRKCFGGRRESTDADAIAGVRREVRQEAGISPRDYDIDPDPVWERSIKQDGKVVGTQIFFFAVAAPKYTLPRGVCDGEMLHREFTYIPDFLQAAVHADPDNPVNILHAIAVLRTMKYIRYEYGQKDPLQYFKIMLREMRIRDLEPSQLERRMWQAMPLPA